MNQSQLSLIAALDQAAEVQTSKDHIPDAESLLNAKRSRKASQISETNRDASCRYIPVYHIELVRDRQITVEPPATINNPDDVVAILKDELLRADREKLVCLTLNAKHVVIGIEIVSVGTLTASVAHPREIFKGAILKNAAAIILAHNHPSGDPSPSSEDIQLTKRIKEAGELLGIELLDHVILGHLGSHSFRTAGRIP